MPCASTCDDSGVAWWYQTESGRVGNSFSILQPSILSPSAETSLPSFRNFMAGWPSLYIAMRIRLFSLVAMMALLYPTYVYICWIFFLYVGDLLVIFCSGSHDAMTSTLTLRWSSSLPVPTLVVARGCWCCVCQTQPGQQQQHRPDECLQHLRTSVGCWEDLNSGYFRQSRGEVKGGRKSL